MFDFYATNQDKGFPGMKANVTVDTVDSFASEGGVNPGDPVIRGTDPEKQVKAAAASDGPNVIGIAVHTHKDPGESGAYYEDGYCLPVMTSGDVYVQAGEDVTAGGAVALGNVENKVSFIKASSTLTTSFNVPNMTYMESGTEGDIVRVRIRN